MTRRDSVSFVISLTLVAAACGKDDKTAASSGGDKAAAGHSTAQSIDPAAANALVPEELKGKLEFEKREIQLERGDETTYTFAAPKGWKVEGIFGTLKPESDMGFFTEMRVGSDCGGRCEKKNWEEVANKSFFDRLTQAKVHKDEKGKSSRLVIADTDEAGIQRTEIVYAWWSEGAEHYHHCTVKLHDEAKPAVAAFEKACQAVLLSED